MRGPGCHLGRATGTGVALLLALIVAACGSPSGSTPKVRPASPSPRGTATPITTTEPGDPTLLPVPANIPFLQAPAPIQNEWRQYYATGAITVVPNSTVPFQRPATPQVVNDTNGAVDNTTAYAWGDALMREAAWENWAITADQLSLLDSGVISAPAVTAGVSLPSGATGLTITGSRWPSSLRLVKVTASAQSFLSVTDAYAFIVTFAEGWSVSAVFPDGHTEPLPAQIAAPGAGGFVTGHLQAAQDFGELWFGSVSLACDASEPPTVQALCAE